jgi:hypothetical protein
MWIHGKKINILFLCIFLLISVLLIDIFINKMYTFDLGFVIRFQIFMSI